MIYEGVNTCVGDSGGSKPGNGNAYISTGIATSLDYGKTWSSYRGTPTFSFVPLPAANKTQGPNAPSGALGKSVCVGDDSQLGLSPHRSADLVDFRSPDRQGCGAPTPERSLPAGVGFGRSLVALTLLGHTKDSLWSCDLLRCESATLRTYWVLLVIDQFTRRISGFGVHCAVVAGVALCRMFKRAIRGHSLPKYLSSDHAPLYRFHPWQANLRVLEVEELKRFLMCRSRILSSSDEQ